MERTLLLVKPDGVARGLVGEVLGRLEAKGLKLVGLKLMRVSSDLAERHYGVHKARPFYPALLKFITSGPVVAVAVQGVRAVEVVRTLMGPTFGFDAPPGTIRGDFGLSKSLNVVHGSDSRETADFELGLYFRADELVAWPLPGEEWIANPAEDA